MTLPRLLFMLGQKGVVLSEGKGGRVRFNPRRPVSPAMKAAIQNHKPALLALLRGEDLADWAVGRLQPAVDGDGYEYDVASPGYEPEFIEDYDADEFIDDGGDEPTDDDIEQQMAEFEAAYER